MTLSPEWPAVRPFHEERIISLEEPVPDVPLVFTIRTDSDVQYRLECHTGDYEDMTLINFSGAYQCAMFAMKRRERTSWNLFADDSAVQRSADWFNRGRMTEGQLRGIVRRAFKQALHDAELPDTCGCTICGTPQRACC